MHCNVFTSLPFRWTAHGSSIRSIFITLHTDMWIYCVRVNVTCPCVLNWNLIFHHTVQGVTVTWLSAFCSRAHRDVEWVRDSPSHGPGARTGT